MLIDRKALDALPPEQQKEAKKALDAIEHAAKHDPLYLFEPHPCKLCKGYVSCGPDHRAPQYEFGIAQTRIQAAFAGNRFGKCGDVNTPVRMADGSVKRLGDIKAGEYVVGVNLDGTTSPARVLEWVDQGVKDVYEHRFSKRGAEASFIATAEHKMLARPESTHGRDKGNRIVPAETVTTRWVAQRILGYEAQTQGADEEYATFLGLMLGDGCCRYSDRWTRTMCFTNADSDQIALMRGEVERVGYALSTNRANTLQHRIARRGVHGTRSPLHDKARELGLFRKAHEKRIPSIVESWSNPAVAKLIAGLLLTDGSVSHGSEAPVIVSFCSTSCELATGLRRLLEERFGVYGATVHRSERESKPGHNRRPVYSFAISNYASLVRLAESIPLVGIKARKLRERLALWSGKRSDGANLVFREHRYVGKRPTCDIVIDNETHLFALANGLAISNTTALVTKALVQHVPDEVLPNHLKPFKYVTHGLPVKGRLFAPTEDAIQQITKPELQKWAPRSLLAHGNFDKAWSKQFSTLSFKDGGLIECCTYRQEPETLVGAARDYIGYDEPPPKSHRNESKVRLVDRDGFEMFAMTPVNMGAEALGFVFQDIFMQQESPDITVIRATIWDNPRLSPQAIDAALSIYDEQERDARAKGDFIHFGGMVYHGGFEHVLCDPPDPEHVKEWNVIVGIDPGLKNAAFIWVGFDSENTAWVFDEVLLQEKTPVDYAAAIKATNKKWGLRRPLYVIDPSARNRSLVNKEDVQAELTRQGIPTVAAQNPVQAGVQQIRRRIEQKAFYVAKNLAGLREEALLYGMKEGEEFEIIKRRDHRLDAARYCCAQRPFYVRAELQSAKYGFDPKAGTVGRLRPKVPQAGPLGSMA